MHASTPVSAGYGQEDLVELALMACLGALDYEDHGQRKGGYQCREDGFPPGRESRRHAQSSARVLGEVPPARLRWATAAPC
jgi:hypothetical protein